MYLQFSCHQSFIRQLSAQHNLSQFFVRFPDESKRSQSAAEGWQIQSIFRSTIFL